MNYYSRNLNMPFEDVVRRITASLRRQGFGVITSIDLQKTFHQKLNVDFRRYMILGACNPDLAYRAVSLESHMGVMLPCNVVIQEHENGNIEVSAINPMESIDMPSVTEQLQTVAHEASNRLRTAVDDLHRDVIEVAHPEALPTDEWPHECGFPIQG